MLFHVSKVGALAKMMVASRKNVFNLFMWLSTVQMEWYKAE